MRLVWRMRLRRVRMRCGCVLGAGCRGCAAACSCGCASLCCGVSFARAAESRCDAAWLRAGVAAPHCVAATPRAAVARLRCVAAFPRVAAVVLRCAVASPRVAAAIAAGRPHDFPARRAPAAWPAAALRASRQAHVAPVPRHAVRSHGSVRTRQATARAGRASFAPKCGIVIGTAPGCCAMACPRMGPHPAASCCVRSSCSSYCW